MEGLIVEAWGRFEVGREDGIRMGGCLLELLETLEFDSES